MAGQKLARHQVTIDLDRTIDRLRCQSASSTNKAPLLRIYWYDGLSRGELSQDQQRLAYMEDVKLRLGIVNQAGQQKGVDSLIVTDLVELARNHAISDAVLLSGDEDLRIGVQIAQSFGVRVHLIGIEPSRGSQSLSLLQEADTTTEWSSEELSEVMKLAPGFSESTEKQGNETLQQLTQSITTDLDQAIDAFLSQMTTEDITGIAALQEFDPIPSQFDRNLLASCRAKMGRNLDNTEKLQMRRTFKEKAGEALKGSP